MLKGTLICNNSLSPFLPVEFNSSSLLIDDIMLLEGHDVQVQQGSCRSPRLIRPSQCPVRFLGTISQDFSVPKSNRLHVVIFINLKYIP